MLKKNPALFIAKRYFVAQRQRSGGNTIFVSLLLLLWGAVPLLWGNRTATYKKAVDNLAQHNFIKILTNISMIGVGVGTASLIIILSVFNGLEELTRGLYHTYNPEIRITPAMGKSFEVDSLLLLKIRQITHVKAVTEVIEDDAFLRYDNAEMMVVIKGVSENYLEQYPIDRMLQAGTYELYNHSDSIRLALIGIGVQYQLSIQLGNREKSLLFYYPRKGRKIVLDPEKALLRKGIMPGGVVAIEQQFDSRYVMVPLDFARELLQYDRERSSLEIKVDEPGNIAAVQQALIGQLGSGFVVKNAEEQQASVLRAVKIERLFVFVTFVFVLAIASFNVFFSLAMLAIEKKKDVAIMFSFGASASFVRKIFLLEGMIIAFSGAAFGLLFGFLVVYIQQEFGVVPLGVPSSVVDAYPVKLKIADFISTGSIVVLITVLASYIPAFNASRTKLHEQL